MDADVGVGLGALALVVGFPLLLLLFIVFLGRLEAWMLMPDERAAKVSRLLEQVDEAEELERAVITMLSDVTPETRRQREEMARRWATRVAGLRRSRRRAQAERERADAAAHRSQRA